MLKLFNSLADLGHLSKHDGESAKAWLYRSSGNRSAAPTAPQRLA